MTESKIEIAGRLRPEGRWVEASRFKDEAMKEFRSKGIRIGRRCDRSRLAGAGNAKSTVVSKRVV